MIYSVDKPNRDCVEDFDSVAAIRRKVATKKLLHDIRDNVLETYKHYDDSSGSPGKIQAISADEPTTKALQGNYRHTYPDHVLSELRSQALSSAPAGICPMCTKGSVSDLDHYLPKDQFPEFSIFALNLIPVCNRCNSKKLNLNGSSKERFFHAFYDKIPATPSLLVADVKLKNRSAIVSFRINDRLPVETFLNANFHFTKLQLHDVYMGAGVQELVERIPTFALHHSISGAAGVAAEAIYQAKHLRKKFGAQYWKAALYDSIATNRSFCDRGFLRLDS